MAAVSGSVSRIRLARARGRAVAFGVLLAAPVFACSDPAEPVEREVRISVAGGDAQFGLPGATLDLPLTARATDPTRGLGVRDIAVTWRVVDGQGASIRVITTRTDGAGFASAELRLGSATGMYRVEATSSRNVGAPAAFTARAVTAPAVQQMTPGTAEALETVTITGAGFSAVAAENTVRFGGLRARVLAASATSLTVEVPRCVLDRDVELRVALGSVASQPLTVRTVAKPSASITLDPGEFARFDAPDELACIRIAGGPPGARFLVVPQNAAGRFGLPMSFQFLGMTSGGPLTEVVTPLARLTAAGAADRFEIGLRLRERVLRGQGPTPTPAPALQPYAADPQLGEARDFNVLTSDNRTRRIRAHVRALSSRAIIYVDQDAPGGGLSPAELESFGRLFDDPIYPTVVDAFGEPSDIDANSKIIILFTPAVNALTESTESSFIAGYFYGCDLVDRTRCSASNGGEIFYSMVPDPNGQFGASRSKETVLRTVPGVLAHEFQHMITFHRKGGSLDLLWLSEGLAHAAEDIVGDVFVARGDPDRATEFQRPNYVRAQRWLRQVPQTSLVAEASPGTLEQRGAAWVFVRYLTEQYGGFSVLRTLSQNAAVGDANVTQATNRPWAELVAEFAVAVWADRAPELAGLTLSPRLTLRDFDLRAGVGSLQGGFPLNPAVIPFADFMLSGLLEPAAQNYHILEAPVTGPADLHVAFNGRYGGNFAAGEAPQLTLLRIR